MSIPFISANAAHETKDTDWIRESFIIPQADIDQEDRFWCTFTSTDQDFQDTRLGGSLAVNPYPQFTHFADPCLSSVNKAHHPSNAGNMDSIHTIRDEWGAGHYYHEAFFENQQLIHVQCGHIRFKGVLSFFLGMYDGHAGLLARTGRTGITYWLGKTAMTLVTLPLQIYSLAGQTLNFVLNRPTSQYAYLSPAMGSYWNRATMIGNAFATNMHIVQPLWSNTAGTDDMDEVLKGDDENEEYREYAYRKTGGVVTRNGAIDYYLLANGPQRIANRMNQEMRQIAEESTSKEDHRRRIMEYLTAKKVADPGGIPLRTYLEKFHNSVFGNMDKADVADIPTDIASEDIADVAVTQNTAGQAAVSADPAAAAATPPADGAAAPAEGEAAAAPPAPSGPEIVDDSQAQGMMTKWVKGENGVFDRIRGWASEGAEYMKADLDYGSQFVTFRVDDTGSVSESFSSQTRESEIQSTLNGFSKGMRSKAFSFAGGNTGIWVVDQAKTALAGFVTGALDAVHLSGLYALMGASYVDIPHHWEDSTASFPTLSYTCDLIPASGNDLARLISIYTPVSLALAMGLPMSTGGATYTAPFYCQVYDRGRNIIRLGMMDSLSLEWGVTNLGFNNDFKPLSCRMSFGFKDMSNVLHAPADTGFDVLKPWKGVITDDTKFTDYLGMRSSLSMGDMLFPQRKLRLRMTKRALDYDSYFSRSHWSNAISNSKPAYLMAGLFGDAQAVNIVTNR